DSSGGRSAQGPPCELLPCVFARGWPCRWNVCAGRHHGGGGGRKSRHRSRVAGPSRVAGEVSSGGGSAHDGARHGLTRYQRGAAWMRCKLSQAALYVSEEISVLVARTWRSGSALAAFSTC